MYIHIYIYIEREIYVYIERDIIYTCMYIYIYIKARETLKEDVRAARRRKVRTEPRSCFGGSTMSMNVRCPVLTYIAQLRGITRRPSRFRGRNTPSSDQKTSLHNICSGTGWPWHYRYIPTTLVLSFENKSVHRYQSHFEPLGNQ